MQMKKNKSIYRIILMCAMFSIAFVFSMLLGLNYSKICANAESETGVYHINVSSPNGISLLAIDGAESSSLISNSLNHYVLSNEVVEQESPTYQLRVRTRANKYYEFDKIIINDVEQTSGVRVFKLEKGTYINNVVVVYKPIEIKAVVKTQIMTGSDTFIEDSSLIENQTTGELDNIVAKANSSLFDNVNNVFAINRGNYVFEGFYIQTLSDEIDVTDGRKIRTLELNEQFLNEVLDETSNSFTIVARYSLKKQVSISMQDGQDEMGNFEVAVYGPRGEHIDFVSGAYYEYGTRFSIVPVNNEYYEFDHFVVNESDDFSNNLIINVEYDDIDVKCVFASTKYDLCVSIVNSVFKTIGNQRVNVSIVRQIPEVLSPVSRYVQIGDTIDYIRFGENLGFENYVFDSWKVLDKTGNAVDISHSSLKNEVRDLDINKTFIDQYVKDGRIVIYGVFVQQCYLSINLPNEIDFLENFSVYKRVDGDYVKLENLDEPFEYGTVLMISVPSVNNHKFDGFTGLVAEDSYTTGQTSAFIVMNGNRTITAKYVYDDTPVNISGDSKIVNCKLVKNLDKIHVGQTLILSFELSSGYELTKFEINNMKAQEFVSSINSLDPTANQVAFYDDSGIVTIYVTQKVFDFFKANPSLKICSDGQMRGTYLALIIVYSFLAVCIGASIIVFAVLASKKQNKIVELKTKQQEIILKKQNEEQERKEKEAMLNAKQNESSLKKKTVKAKTPVKSNEKSTNSKNSEKALKAENEVKTIAETIEASPKKQTVKKNSATKDLTQTVAKKTTASKKVSGAETKNAQSTKQTKAKGDK